MSCIRFNTGAQREAMRGSAALSNEDAAVLHLAPPVTESKLARLRLLAQHESAGIRSSAASSRHAPADLLASLAADADPSVRASVARNETAPPAVLAALAADSDEQVRSWAVVNVSTPDSAVAGLDADTSAQVRRLVAWRRGA